METFVTSDCSGLIVNHEVIRLDVAMADVLAVQDPDCGNDLEPLRQLFSALLQVQQMTAIACRC